MKKVTIIATLQKEDPKFSKNQLTLPQLLRDRTESPTNKTQSPLNSDQ